MTALAGVFAVGFLECEAAVHSYSADAATLHLWHFDEPAGVPVVADSRPGGVVLGSIASGATLGNASAAGFGSALRTYDAGPTATLSANPNGVPGRDAVASPVPMVSGTGDNLALAHDGADGAFTFEALVYVDFNPTAQAVSPDANRQMQIIGADAEEAGTSGGANGRLFQFRLSWASVNDTTPALEFINLNTLAAGGNQSLSANVPTSGPDAIAQGQWYHVAVTYNGAENTAGNARLYWTKLDPARSQATLLASFQMTHDLPDVAPDWSIGNDGRSGVDSNWVGLVDEVRFSNIARSATAFVFTNNSDNDGLDDGWEMGNFNSLAQLGTDDPDGDLATNAQEFAAGSLPTNPASTPSDIDADALPDLWEQTYFQTLARNATQDSDADGFTNAQELAAGTNPANPLSRPGDTDADGLTDAWELLFFGSLAAQTGAGDADGDGFTNAEEAAAKSLPTNAASVPGPPLATFAEVDDGNAATSEWAYAGSSGINTISTIADALVTVGDYQFLAYYGRHRTDTAYAFNNKIWIARRLIGASVWEIFRTNFTANAITDGHDTISIGFDGEGVLHMSWGMHADAYHYARTTTPVTSGQPIAFTADGTMTGNENTVTYPQFLPMPNGDLLYYFREGGSGAGDSYFNRYNVATRTWSNIHTTAGVQQPFLKGRTWSPDYNAYPNMPCVDASGNVFLVWTWRYNTGSPAGEAGYQTNHDFAFAKSADYGLTWRRQNANAYTLPISQFGENGDPNTTAERVLVIPEGSSLINSGGMCLDQTGQPVIGTWWAPATASGNYRRQYMVAFSTPTGWQSRQVSNRTNDPTTTKYPEANVRDLGRPIIVTDKADRIIAVYRDNARTNGLTVVHSLPRADDPERLVWIEFDITTDNLGSYESVYDRQRWARDGVLHLLVQASEGQGYVAASNTASPIGVVEWDAAAYFAQQPRVNFTRANAGADVVLEWQSKPSWEYQIFTSTNLTDWGAALATFAGTGGLLNYTHPGGASGPRRFWRIEMKEGGYP